MLGRAWIGSTQYNNKRTAAIEQSQACLTKNAYSLIQFLESKLFSQRGYVEQITEVEFWNKEATFDFPSFQHSYLNYASISLGARDFRILCTSHTPGIFCSLLQNGLPYLEKHWVENLKKPCQISLRLSTKCVRYYFWKIGRQERKITEQLFLKRNNNGT